MTHSVRLLLLPLFLLGACASQKIVGGGCHYEQFHGSCRFVALERGAGQVVASYDFGGVVDGVRHLTAKFDVDDDHVAAFEAYLRANPVMPCAWEQIVAGPCTPVVGKVEVPAFDGATPNL